MKKLMNYFFQGLLYIVPIVVTLYVVLWTFRKIDGILPFQFPGLGLIVIFILIVIIYIFIKVYLPIKFYICHYIPPITTYILIIYIKYIIYKITLQI